MTDADNFEDSEQLQHHLALRRNDVARYVLLPGDPARVEKIAARWDSRKMMAQHREFTTYTGVYRGTPISCTSTGIGGPAAAIVIEQLLRVGADTFIRVGSTGALDKKVGVGDLIITTASVRFDGTTNKYVWPGYPASANYEVVLALVEAAESLGVRYHTGITASSDSLYVGQGRPGFGGYITKEAVSLVSEAKKARVLNFEMESSTLFTLSNIYGARAGSICAARVNRETHKFVQDAGEKEAIEVANEAVRILHQWDTIKKKKRKTNFFPSLLS